MAWLFLEMSSGTSAFSFLQQGDDLNPCSALSVPGPLL